MPEVSATLLAAEATMPSEVELNPKHLHSLRGAGTQHPENHCETTTATEPFRPHRDLPSAGPGTSTAIKVLRCPYWRKPQPARGSNFGKALAPDYSRSPFSGNMFICVGEGLGLGTSECPLRALSNIALASVACTCAVCTRNLDLGRPRPLNLSTS